MFTLYQKRLSLAHSFLESYFYESRIGSFEIKNRVRKETHTAEY